MPTGSTMPENAPVALVRNCVTGVPAPKPGTAAPPVRVAITLASTSGVSSASASPEIVPVEKPRRTAISVIIGFDTAATSFRLPT